MGPTGGGLVAVGLGASPPSGGAVVAAGGAAASSDARTTNLKLALLVLFFGKKMRLVLLETDELVLVATFGVTTNPEAADAMLAMSCYFTLSFFLSFSSTEAACVKKMIKGNPQKGQD